MGKLLIINGSPRASKSNSKQYVALFQKYWNGESSKVNITPKNHTEICEDMAHYTDVLLVFPLYVDSIPVTLHNFLKTLEQHPPKQKPRISMVVNCGFLEPEQNQIAVEMIKLFCKQQGYPFLSVLCIGGGEAILNTPFRFLVKRKIKQLVKSVASHQSLSFQVTMPISKETYLKASTKYWIRYGAKNGVTKEQMDTMEIETN